MVWQETVLQVTAAVVREAISDAITRNAKQDYDERTKAAKRTNEEDGCPYCACADYLASAALLYYDSAQDEKLAEVAKAKVHQAHSALMKREVLMNPKGVELIAAVAAITESEAEPKETARKCLEVRKLALALAGARIKTQPAAEESNG